MKKSPDKKKPAPMFPPHFCVPDRCIAADDAGNLWVVDPLEGTVTPVKVKNNAS